MTAPVDLDAATLSCPKGRLDKQFAIVFKTARIISVLEDECINGGLEDVIGIRANVYVYGSAFLQLLIQEPGHVLEFNILRQPRMAYRA